ncbi:TIGR02186 family protein [Novosphingobium mangrovi (ex Hu et al. 2023)]|uniref:TIGR02186 family protein n=1 Tax=Novosphingobium mangrovi (ex Hu et al. 2023) TaxID=2930094 RepID=A0ABT0AH49_9SPHN|nr:TIGR02186 family protein [Novosphingobium mangrovi (ex Hu et al. 2023)]MCJ1962519.1 TIGR02186 family protein [Novosphingobium mangrovi (ex Hu et al. 2023)]
MNRLLVSLLALFALVFLGGARDPILVPEVSQHQINLQQGFNGTDLLLFGAVLTPEGSRAAQDYDIVVVLKGPTQSVVLREKQKVAEIWVNAASTELRSAPSYYAVASTRPIADIVDEKTAAIYELGLQWLQLSPIGAIDPEEQARFSAGLVARNVDAGLYREDEGGVSVSEQVLYQARIRLPSQVPIGRYTAETFAISDGRVVASASSEVEVRKLGIERAIADFSQNWGFAYGLLAVFVSVGMGWLAGRLFALV